MADDEGDRNNAQTRYEEDETRGVSHRHRVRGDDLWAEEAAASERSYSCFRVGNAACMYTSERFWMGGSVYGTHRQFVRSFVTSE